MPTSKTNHQAASIKHSAPLWRNWDYLLLWSGQAISSIVSQLSQFALPLFVLALTGSPVWAGVAGGLRTMPYLFLSLPAGALADPWNPKWLMLVSNSLRALCLPPLPHPAFNLPLPPLPLPP